MPKSAPLTVAYVDGEIRISIGIDIMLAACGEGAIVGGGISEPGMFRVTDADGFAADVVSELERDAEDGTTPVHRLFDAAINEAIESGSEHVEEVDGEDADEPDDEDDDEDEPDDE